MPEIIVHEDYPAGVREWIGSEEIHEEPEGSEWATCGHCGRTWDDDRSTSWTPVPAGRCPFEYDHEYEDDD